MQVFLFYLAHISVAEVVFLFQFLNLSFVYSCVRSFFLEIQLIYLVYYVSDFGVRLLGNSLRYLHSGEGADVLQSVGN